MHEPYTYHIAKNFQEANISLLFASFAQVLTFTDKTLQSRMNF